MAIDINFKKADAFANIISIEGHDLRMKKGIPLYIDEKAGASLIAAHRKNPERTFTVTVKVQMAASEDELEILEL